MRANRRQGCLRSSTARASLCSPLAVDSIDSIHLFGHEARVLEKQQECEVVEEADEQPHAAAGQQRSHGHEQHEQGERHRGHPLRPEPAHERSGARAQPGAEQRHVDRERPDHVRVVADRVPDIVAQRAAVQCCSHRISGA